MPVASRGYFAISKETTPGTAITTPTKFYPVEEVDFQWENEFIDLREIRGSRQAYTVLDGAIQPTAMIRGAVYPAGAMGLILFGLFGAKSASAVSGSTIAYRHTFSDGAVLPSFTLERADARSGEGGVICERLAGCKVESLSLSAAFGEKVDMEVQFQAAKKPVTATPVSAASITYPTMSPLIFAGAAIEVNDAVVSNFKSINVEIRNTLERQNALNGTRETYKIFEGGQECTISATMVFEDLTMYDNLVNATEVKLELLMQSATIADDAPTPDIYYALNLTWDRVRVQRYSIPFRSGEVIEADVDFRVLFNPATNRATLAEMVNLDTTTTYDS